jgi:hypothetical protein
MGTNPYASPAATASFSPTSMTTSTYGARPGLPWEQSQSLGSWWETAKMVMGSPNHAFRVMRQYGGFGHPILYSMLGLGIGGIGQIFWQILFAVGVAMLANQGGGEDAASFILMQVVSSVFGTALGVVIGATLGLFIGAAIGHLFLMMVGGANRGYEVTFRVVGFANGSLGWLNWIPYLGPLISFFWLLYLSVVGYAAAHEIPTSKAVWAVVLQVVVCFVIPMAIFAILMAGLIAAAIGASQSYLAVP